MGQIRNILVLAVLLGCDKAPDCGWFNAPIKLAATAVSKELECNELKVEASIKNALVKMKVCSENVGYSELNGSNALCNFLPILVTAIGDNATKTWECKKTGAKLSDVLKKAMQCH